jgi:hypothetical protein
MGKAMAGLKYNSQYKLAWSVIEDDSFVKTNSADSSIQIAIRELAQSSPEFDVFFLIYAADDGLHGILNFSEKKDMQTLIKSLNGRTEDGQIIFTPAESEISAAEKEVLRKIKEWLDGQK